MWDGLIILTMVMISRVQILGHEVAHLKYMQWDEEKKGVGEGGAGGVALGFRQAEPKSWHYHLPDA